MLVIRKSFRRRRGAGNWEAVGSSEFTSPGWVETIGTHV